MAEPAADSMVYPVMQEMAACLQSEYGEDLMADPALVTGDNIPLTLGEDCELIAGYVRVVLGYPSDTAFPAPETTTTACTAPLAFQLFVGVARCVPVPDNTEWALDAPTTTAITERHLADMAAMRRAIVCCLGGDKFEDLLYTIVQWAPAPSEANIAISEWQVVVQELML